MSDGVLWYFKYITKKKTNNVTRQALDWNPQGKRKTGRHKTTWKRSIAEGVKKHGNMERNEESSK